MHRHQSNQLRDLSGALSRFIYNECETKGSCAGWNFLAPRSWTGPFPPASWLLEMQQYLLDLQVSGVATKTESPWHTHSSPWARATSPVTVPAGSVQSCVLRNKVSVIELFATPSPRSAWTAEPAGSWPRARLVPPPTQGQL